LDESRCIVLHALQFLGGAVGSAVQDCVAVV